MSEGGPGRPTLHDSYRLWDWTNDYDYDGIPDGDFMWMAMEWRGSQVEIHVAN
jgi:hypothetical protein